MTISNTKPIDATEEDETDLRLVEAAKARLKSDPMVNEARIRISAAAGRVTLEGRVTDQWSKDRIETALAALDGISEIDNQIEVKHIIIYGQS